VKRLHAVRAGLAALTRAIIGLFRAPAPATPPTKRLVMVELVEDLPDQARSDVLYIAGEGGNVWAAAMICPCGCRDLIQLNLLQSVRPRWKAHEHENGGASLTPSVWQKKGCNSHFILRAGDIIWCQSGPPPSSEIPGDTP